MYRVAVLGLGHRGLAHLHGFEACKDQFEVVGICDRHEEKLNAAANKHKIENSGCYTDSRRMMNELRPDILCFCTMPHVREELVELAAEFGVKGLMMEKPVANSLTEARHIADLCGASNIKAVVCHQHKYLASLLKLQGFVRTGELGEIYRIEASCQGQLSQLGTHYIDYILWLAEGSRAASVVGHIHGRDLLSDHHPSPDFAMGELVLENGIRAGIQCGYFAEPHAEHEDNIEERIYGRGFWTDDRLIAYGTDGYAWAECNGRWARFSSATGVKREEGSCDEWSNSFLTAQVSYTRDFAEWLGGGTPHPCRLELAYHGCEIMEAICLSALDNTRIDLPLPEIPRHSAFERMNAELRDIPRHKLPRVKW